MSEPVHVVFVCWGNICRSPMAERVARRRAAEEGLTGVEFSSAATSSEELGEPMDPRAATTLRRAGYDADGHVAHRIDAVELGRADLVVAMEDVHVRKLAALGGRRDHVALLTDFDPAAAPGTGVPDPWYGDERGFTDTLQSIEAAVPGLLDRVRELQRER